MNKLLLWIISLGAPCMLMAQAGSEVTITGEVRDPAVKEVYLVYFASHGIRTDSASVTDRSYTIKGQPERGLVAVLTTAGADELPTVDKAMSVFLQPSEQFRIVHKAKFSDAEISGSAANTEYGKLKDVSRDGLAAYITQNPASPLAVFAFNKYVGDPGSIKIGDVPRLRSLFDLLPDSIRNMSNSRAFLQRLDNMVTFEKTAVAGRPAPAFTQNDTAGRPVSLSSFRGKYVLVDFWASWCGPCRMENPAVVAAYRKYHGKGLEIIGVSLDQDRKSWMKAIHDDKLAWTQVSDLKYWDNALVKAYGVQSVPQNFLIDPQGKIIARSLRGADLDNKLAEIFKN